MCIWVYQQIQNFLFRCLAPKLYHGYNDQTQTKQGAKGIPYSVPLKSDDFHKTLLEEEVKKHTVEFGSLRLNRDKEMCSTTMKKGGLTDIFVKLRVDSDKILCKPLTLNGEIL